MCRIQLLYIFHRKVLKAEMSALVIDQINKQEDYNEFT